MPRPVITVVGSLNMDLVVRCERLPQPGQTVSAASSTEVCGGKGANQAVAASRAGGRVSLIGRVGSDGFADRLLANLSGNQIDCAAVRRTNDVASGLAIVAVDAAGENSIVVVPNANSKVCPEDIRQHCQQIEGGDALLAQLEIPPDSVLLALQMARAAGIRTILDPAPAALNLPAEIFDVDLICPNRSEAEILTGQSVRSPTEVRRAAEMLTQRGAKNVAITLGSDGTFVLLENGTDQLIRPFPVTAVDSTAAGDAFAGTLSVFWTEFNDLAYAVTLASAAGAICASRYGAQPAMPHREEIQALAEQVS